MNTQYFFIHVILLGILTVVAFVAAVILAIIWYNEKEENPSWMIGSRTKWGIASVLCFLLFGGGLGWWIASGNEPWRHEYTSLHDIKDVTFPDGTKVQMFTCDNTHHNVTSMFGKVIDEKEWQIRRVRWSPLYLGVSWSCCTRCQQGDHYFLEHKKGEQPSIELQDNLPAEKLPPPAK